MTSQVLSAVSNVKKFFENMQRGEEGELKEDIKSEDKDKQKAAIKKIIGNMTVGKDVSSLFSDVTSLLSTPHMDIKKLVYLYIMNTAKSQPEKASQLASSFARDCQHSQPLIRGLALRTMSAISVEKIADALAEPLRRALRDTDPYVRKTAAIAVAKMYSISKQKVIEGGFITTLAELLCDSNPTCVSNAVAALCEIRDLGGCPNSETLPDVSEFRPATIQTLLFALDEAPEWGRVYILEGIATYAPKSYDEAEQIVDRVLKQMQHSNAAVVMSSVRVAVQFLETWAKKAPDPSTSKKYCQKIGPSLISLCSGGHEPEIRFVALRNITFILQKYPEILQNQLKVFFVKYHDPIFIKLEKLDIMLLLVDAQTVDLCLSEFKEYAEEVDIEVCRKSVRAIGLTAIKIESSSQKCIDVLMQLIQGGKNYVVQESIIVIKDIFRKYPNQYESIIGALCENLDTLDEPDAKASMIWIIGEYADRIENADELLSMFAETFEDEVFQVKLGILTAVVKLALKRPGTGQDLLNSTLKAASDSENPDLRDRAYIYWRLITEDLKSATTVVLAPKEIIIADKQTDEKRQLRDELLRNIATLASVYHKPPSSFLPEHMVQTRKVVYLEDADDEDQEPAEAAPSRPATAAGTATTAAPAPPKDDAWGWFDDIAAPATAPATSQAVERVTQLTSQNGHGVRVDTAYTKTANGILLDVQFTNESNEQRDSFMFQINKNTWGYRFNDKINLPDSLTPGQSFSTQVLLVLGGNVSNTNNFEYALKSQMGLAFFKDSTNIEALLK